MSTSPTPPSPPAAPATTPAAPPPTWKDKLLAFGKKHLVKGLTWLLGGGLTYIDQRFFGLLPIPEELHFRGLLASFICSLVTAIITVTAFGAAKKRVAGPRVRTAWIGIMLLCLVAAIVFVYLFYCSEEWWKSPGSNFQIIYFWVEPGVYGMFFASLAALLTALCLLGYDMIHNP